MRSTLKTYLIALCALVFLTGTVRGDTASEHDIQRYQEVSKLVGELDQRLGEMQRRLARAQADGSHQTVEQIRQQMRGLVIRRDSASFERQLLEARYGEAVTGGGGDRRQGGSGGVVINVEAEWRREQVMQARRAAASDLRRLLL